MAIAALLYAVSVLVKKGWAADGRTSYFEMVLMAIGGALFLKWFIWYVGDQAVEIIKEILG